jgi:hypothetical protein
MNFPWPWLLLVFAMRSIFQMDPILVGKTCYSMAVSITNVCRPAQTREARRQEFLGTVEEKIFSMRVTMSDRQIGFLLIKEACLQLATGWGNRLDYAPPLNAKEQLTRSDRSTQIVFEIKTSNDVNSLATEKQFPSYLAAAIAANKLDHQFPALVHSWAQIEKAIPTLEDLLPKVVIFDSLDSIATNLRKVTSDWDVIAAKVDAAAAVNEKLADLVVRWPR